MELICPKCRGTMRQYERSGVTVDQCTECRGIFLDRGEVRVTLEASGGGRARVAVLDGTRQIAAASGEEGQEVAIRIPSPKLWSPSG